MRVLCVQIIEERTGKPETDSNWLQLDREYDVLEIYAFPGGRVDLRIVPDESGTPALFDSRMFLTTDRNLPSNWEACIDEGGILHMGPAEWLLPGFWEAYFDQDPRAIAAYERGSAGLS